MDAFYTVDELRPRISLGYLLRRINKLSTAQVEAAFDGNDISFTQWVVLALIASGTANTCSDLSRDMDHNSGAMTRVVDQLEERGLLVRRRDEGDRRISKLIITDTGKETFAQLARSVVGVWNEILQGFERDEVLQLIATLNKLLVRFEELESREGQ
jgi:DNA-binding MarR family transcriptional regulator